MIELTCMGCSKSFSRNLSLHNSNIKRGRTIIACSNSCVQVARYGQPVDHHCINCGILFHRKKSSSDTFQYCSQSCAAKSNNRIRVITSNEKKCRSCSNSVYGRRVVCQDCKNNYSSRIDWSSVTLQDLKSKYSLAQYHSKIRGMARSEYKRHSKDMSCRNCGYSLHIDICHIKSIAKFSLEATISEVNHINNLIGLDKRCHWEFDNGYITIEQINAPR